MRFRKHTYIVHHTRRILFIFGAGLELDYELQAHYYVITNAQWTSIRNILMYNNKAHTV